jgi:glycosyltransferase involved in cell wall biosynthesis
MIAAETSAAIKNATAPKRRQRDKLLWIMNTTLLGGSTLWVLDAIESLGNWQHEVVFIQGEEVPHVAERFRQAAAPISRASVITREMIDAIAPAVVILSNTNPDAIEGEHPWSWLMNGWPVISVHHSAVRPWIPGAHADVFVSKHLFAMYSAIAPRMARKFVIPPGIDTAAYAAIDRPAGGGRCVIGRHSSGGAAKYPQALLQILREVGTTSMIVGGAEHYPDADPTLFSFPPIGSQHPIDFLRDIDIFVYRSDTTETWCRSVTEAMGAGLPCVADRRGGIAEQIEDGVTGFLCDGDLGFVDRLRLLVRNPGLRFEMGMRARIAAMRMFDVRRFRDTLEPLMMEAARR